VLFYNVLNFKPILPFTKGFLQWLAGVHSKFQLIPQCSFPETFAFCVHVIYCIIIKLNFIFLSSLTQFTKRHPSDVQPSDFILPFNILTVLHVFLAHYFGVLMIPIDCKITTFPLLAYRWMLDTSALSDINKWTRGWGGLFYVENMCLLFDSYVPLYASLI